jgi:hypothetical protein
MNPQLIGSYIDVMFLLGLGLVGLFVPDKLIGKGCAEEERRKKIKVLKISGAVVLLGGLGKLILKFV